RRARSAAAAADLVLFVVDAGDWERARALVPRGRPALLVVNKTDRAPATAAATGLGMPDVVAVSARTGAGLKELRERIARRLGGEEALVSGGRYRVNVRQYGLLREAREALARAAASGTAFGVECLALDLRAALEALGGVTGRFVGEELLDRIFSRFCLGK
ncbi:MAG: tRNA uridine-5-carboxymethylaminomethyl(34) synthesis GTPase MnmE, partial [Planctomycetota bacterium]